MAAVLQYLCLCPAKRLFELLRLVYNSFRQCTNCGSLWVSLNHGLCAECWQHIQVYRSQSPGQRPAEGGELTSYALFLWPPQASDALSGLILGNKGWSPPRAAKILSAAVAAAYAVARLSAVDKKMRSSCRGPSQRAAWRDQGYLLAREVAWQTGFPFCPVLRTRSYRTQRRLGRVARLHLRIEKNSGMSLRGKHVFFVDDVVTTGATAILARKALSEAADFTVCCLADRNLSCEQPEVLL